MSPQNPEDFFQQSTNNMELINLSLYPLNKPESNEYKSCISKLREQLSQTGVAACPDFLKSEAVLQAVQDTEKVKHKGVTKMHKLENG